MNSSFENIISWLFKDKNGAVVLVQFPNWQLIGASITWLIQFVITNGVLHDSVRVAFIVLMIMWAYEEILYGVNGFRRILGTLVISTICLELYQLFESSL